jgi:hypothetical protein
MDPFCKVLMNDEELNYKFAEDLQVGDVIFPEQTLVFKSATNSLMYEINFCDSTRIVLDYTTSILVSIPCQPVVDFDENSSTFTVEYIKQTQKFIKTKIPLRKIAKLNIIRKQHSQVQFLSVSSLEHIFRSNLSQNGIFAVKKTHFSDVDVIETNIDDFNVDFTKIINVQPVRMTGGRCIRLFFDSLNDCPIRLPMIIEDGFVVK